MLREEKNLDSSDSGTDIAIKDTSVHLSYTKTNKLVTALYMVTDILDKDEPLRNKLRTLGTEIISDTYSIQQGGIGQVASLMLSKVSETLSFLDIASAMNIISEMNSKILQKEFLELSQSIKYSMGSKSLNREINLSEFFNSPFDSPHSPPLPSRHLPLGRGRENSIGHRRSNSIGVQKASTLMQALSDRNFSTSNTNFELLRKQRQQEIKDSIRANGGNATIKDIKDKAQGSLKNCGEKTLQRELFSMVKIGVLNKTGEKRWSRYFLV